MSGSDDTWSFREFKNKFPTPAPSASTFCSETLPLDEDSFVESGDEDSDMSDDVDYGSMEEISDGEEEPESIMTLETINPHEEEDEEEEEEEEEEYNYKYLNKWATPKIKSLACEWHMALIKKNGNRINDEAKIKQCEKSIQYLSAYLDDHYM